MATITNVRSDKSGYWGKYRCSMTGIVSPSTDDNARKFGITDLIFLPSLVYRLTNKVTHAGTASLGNYDEIQEMVAESPHNMLDKHREFVNAHTLSGQN